MNNLDLRTILYLYITGVVIKREKKYTIKKVSQREVYIFKNYEEFKSYFEQYMVNVKEDVINLAIYTKSSKGVIVALKGLCDRIITTSKIKNGILNLNQEQINDIHSRGKITPIEKVEEWESMDLCAPGDEIGSAKDRCHYFEYNCHMCLLEYASQEKEYDKIELKLTNGLTNHSPVLKKTKK